MNMRPSRLLAVVLAVGHIVGCDLISTVGDESVLAERGPHTVVERKEYFSERTYHYSPSGVLGDTEAYTFLFGSCPTDCSERLEQSGFAPDGEHFAFRIGNSTRYDSRTRLLLYTFRAGAVQTLLDKTDETVTGYRFTDSTLVYSVRGAPEQSVALTRP